MKKTTLFARLKDFINTRWAWSDNPQFTTKELRDMIGEYENQTGWKKFNKQPNYLMHCYLGELHALGCIERVKHGVYEINGRIPGWFGSYHFKGLKGELNDSSNLYWNALPGWQKINPWSTVKSKQKEPDIDAKIAAMEWSVKKQAQELEEISQTLNSLKEMARNLSMMPELRDKSTVTKVTYTIKLNKQYWWVTRSHNDDAPNVFNWEIADINNEPLLKSDSLFDVLVDYCEQI